METHLAGPELVWDGRYMRQRCAWCGALLIDYELENIMVEEGQEGWPASWPAMSLVRTDGPISYVVDGETSEDGFNIKVPEDCCMKLDPAATR